MKSSMFSKLMVLVLLGSFHVVAYGAATSTELSDDPSLSAKRGRDLILGGDTLAQSSALTKHPRALRVSSVSNNVQAQAVVPTPAEAMAKYRSGDLLGSLQLLEMIAQDPSSDRYLANALMLSGDIYARGTVGLPRDFPKAIDYYNRALAVNALPAEMRARLLRSLGNLFAMGGSGIARDINAALTKYREALATGSLFGAAKTEVDDAIARISVELAGKRHGQFIIYLDENVERPDSSDGDQGPVTYGFATSMHFESDLYQASFRGLRLVPFLVSRSIVWNFLVRNRRAEIGKDDLFIGSINWDLWNVYNIKGTQFLLFVPKVSTPFYLSQLKLATQEVLPNNKIDLYNWFESDVENQFVKPAESFKPEDLSKVFKIRKDFALDQNIDPPVIWDIIVQGHGTSAESFGVAGASVAGISLFKMQELLKYLNNELYMGALLVETCSVGGKNSTLLQFDQAVESKTLLNLNYIVIIASVSDRQTRGSNRTPFMHQDFFEKTANESSLGDIIKSLTTRLEVNSIPQIWVPGGYGFQTYQVDERVKILSKALVAAREDENRPIIVSETTQVILVYPQEINVPVIIKSPQVVLVSMLKDVSRNSYHHFKHIEFEKKEAIAPFLKDLSQDDNARVEIDLLTCAEDPSYRKKFKFGSFSRYAAEPKQLAISLSVQKRLGLPTAAFFGQAQADSSESLVGTSSSLTGLQQNFSVQELFDYGMLPKITTQNGLQQLNLKGKNINDLTGLGVVPGIQDVQILVLDKNNINTIVPGVFVGLNKLQELRLEDNVMTEIVPGAFAGLHSLNKLFLRGNRIRTIKPGTFKELNNLKELWLSNNIIDAVLPGAFWGLDKLERLQLYQNQIAQIPLEALDNLVELKNLDLGGNRIQRNSARKEAIIRRMKEVTKGNITVSWGGTIIPMKVIGSGKSRQ